MPKVMSQFDLRGNAVKNFRIEELTNAPASPDKGRVYFSTAMNCPVFWNEISWIPLDAAKRMGDIPLAALATDPLARANHTGTQAAATISDFAIAVRGVTAIPIGNLNTDPLSRANHTGTQTAATISDFATAVQGVPLPIANLSVDPLARANHTGTQTSATISDFTVAVRGVTAIPIGNLNTDPLARANHTGTQTAATISDFATAVRTNRLDQMAAPTAAVSMNSQRITAVATPTASTDATNKAYVDGLVQGVDAKLTAAAATNAALPSCVYANGTAGVGATLTASVNGVLTVDGYAPTLNELILVKDEVAAANNGLYQLTTLGTASVKWVLTRVIGMDQSNEFGGALIAVQDKGNVNDNTLWLCLAADTVTPGTTALSFTRLNSPTTYTAGNGIDISAQVVAAKLQSGGGLVADASGLAVDTSVVARKYATNVGDGASATIVVTHNLNTEDVVLSLREIATKEEVLVDWEHTSVNTITLKFASAPTAAQFRVVVLG